MKLLTVGNRGDITVKNGILRAKDNRLLITYTYPTSDVSSMERSVEIDYRMVGTFTLGLILETCPLSFPNLHTITEIANMYDWQGTAPKLTSISGHKFKWGKFWSI